MSAADRKLLLIIFANEESFTAPDDEFPYGNRRVRHTGSFGPEVNVGEYILSTLILLNSGIIQVYSKKSSFSKFADGGGEIAGTVTSSSDILCLFNEPMQRPSNYTKFDGIR